MHALPSWVLGLAVIGTPLFAGCILDGDGGMGPPRGEGEAPEVAWSKDPCDPSHARAIAQDVPWIEAWQGSPATLAERFAWALGQTLPPLDEDASSDRRPEWRADSYVVRYTAPVPDGDPHSWWDEGPELLYTTAERWPPGDEEEQERVLRGFVDRFSGGIPLELEFAGHGTFYQAWEGERLWMRHDYARGDGSGRSGWWSGLHFRPLYDLSAARVVVAEEDALHTAETYLGCVLDKEGKTEAAGYIHRDTLHWKHDVRNASLVHQVLIRYEEPPPYGHCGFARVVNVDAKTGAVHGWEHMPCD